MRWKPRWQGQGGGRELFLLAFPLILSNSIWTLQITLDRIFLSWLSSDAVAAAMPAAVLFWAPLSLMQNVANYATTFVAQYVGAGRTGRVGPAVWQALYFSVAGGILFIALVPGVESCIAWSGHSPALQELETVYLRCLCYSALPTLIVAAASSFFTGRGDSWTVLGINTVGLAINGVLDYVLIFGHGGFPALGIEGAGWATVAGMWGAAATSLLLLFRKPYRTEFHTLAGWRFDGDLFRRLMRFGVPSGLQWMLDALAFAIFLVFVGRLGEAELAATSIAFSINMIAVLPMLGMGQAVSVLVGQRLGEDRPDLAEDSTWMGFWLAWLYMTGVAAFYVLAPEAFLRFFESEDAAKWALVAPLVPVLLRFVAVYSLFDSMNLIFSFALRGAGDTRFVMLVMLTLAWPIMVVPTWAAWKYDWGLNWAWAFASAYIIALAITFLFRFRAGKWRSMRVIEQPAAVEPAPEEPPAAAAEWTEPSRVV